MWSKSGKKITNEQLDTRLLNNYPNIKRESDYIDSKTAIKFSCTKCNRIYKKKPKEISKIKCNCTDRRMKYEESLRTKDIELLGNYVSMREKTLHKCKTCDMEFITSPKSILSSTNGCPSCSGKIFSIDKYKSMLPNNIKLLSTEYKGSHHRHKHLCTDCNTEFDTKPNYILHMNTNCPVCSKSKGEREIIEFLDLVEIKYEKEYVVKIEDKKLRFDFYIESIRTFIEYDGIQHFKPVDIFGGEEYYKKLVEYDGLKNRWCIDNEFELVRIPYDLDVFEYLSSHFTN
jgi:predicted  nucleic acid-binding Zn-ribbon protein